MTDVEQNLKYSYAYEIILREGIKKNSFKKNVFLILEIKQKQEIKKGVRELCSDQKISILHKIQIFYFKKQNFRKLPPKKHYVFP